LLSRNKYLEEEHFVHWMDSLVLVDILVAYLFIFRDNIIWFSCFFGERKMKMNIFTKQTYIIGCCIGTPICGCLDFFLKKNKNKIK